MTAAAPIAHTGQLRWCLPKVQGRGAGLGNELIPWARVQLMAQVLGARALAPAFGLNQRAYHRHFGSSRGDWLMHAALERSLPVVDFDEAAYLASGGGDVVHAFGRWAHQLGLHERRALVVRTQGLWGGYGHIARARDWVRARLHASRWAAANLAELGLRLDPHHLTVAMHVRMGDFEAAREPSHSHDPHHEHSHEHYRGRFNTALPLDWFVSAGVQLQQALGARVQFLVFSDGTPEQLRPLTRHLHCVPTHVRHPADVSDLLAMAGADLLLCSVSSYSAWAAFLSQGHYLWFAPQLHPLGQGWGAVWGHEAQQNMPYSPTLQAWAAHKAETQPRAPSRAWAMAPGAELPAGLLAELEHRHALRRPCADLMQYGVVPMGKPHGFHTETR
jgi:hypothetical protein